MDEDDVACFGHGDLLFVMDLSGAPSATVAPHASRVFRAID
jgi:hypothetical protein